MADDGELKACPCCAAEARLMPHALPLSIRHFVQCEHCLLRTPHYSTEAEAIAAWNTRPTLDDARGSTGLVEALIGDAQFLCDRLDQQEWHDDNLAENVNDFMGHVDPAHSRLKGSLAALREATQ